MTTVVSTPASAASAAVPVIVPASARRSRRVAVDIVGFCDVLAILVGGAIPALIYATFGELTVTVQTTLQSCLLTSLFAYLPMRHFGFYDVNNVHDLPVRPGMTMLALVIAFLAVLGVGLPLDFNGPYLWTWYATWLIASFAMIMAQRMVARGILSKLADRGIFDRTVAVFGHGIVAERIRDHLADKKLGIRLAGLYDDRVVRERRPYARDLACGTLEELIALGRTGAVDQVIIALPPTAEGRLAQIARRLEQLPVSLHVCTHLSTDVIGEAPTHQVSNIGPVGLLDIKTKPLSDWAPHLKAAEDYILGAVLLLLALPVMALVALAVRLDSPGPALFRQRRHGLNRRVIEVLKFRTMHVLEDGTEIRQARHGDPRITRIGNFLRATSLDELPQLFNVLRGEMSLVGPRPHALVHDDHYGELVERYANRHQVKPGMTGWAQVKGHRGPTETNDKMQSRVEHDLEYIDSWTLWLDLKILAMTAMMGFTGRNAV
jgi:Undecaprenyl-phosphate glucose phosphotransferase